MDEFVLRNVQTGGNDRTDKLLRLIADSTDAMSQTMHALEALDHLATLVISELCDWTVIITTDDAGHFDHIRAKHRQGHQDLAALTEQMTSSTRCDAIITAVLDGGKAQLVHLENESILFAPLTGRNRIDGVMILIRGPDSPSFDRHDLAVASDLGHRAGLMLDNTRTYESEHHIAETLQFSLLPALPQIDTARAAARYRACETDAFVGGDFYELMPLRSGSLGIAIGDVIGHDVFAAAAMGHLRGVLRACAWDDLDNSTPAAVLERVDEVMMGLQMSTIATLAYMRAEKRDSGDWRLQFSNAGHPPMIVKQPSGEVEVLDGTRDMLLGVQLNPRTSMSTNVDAGSVVIAFTDGLIESRGGSIDDGMELLTKAIRKYPLDPETICDELLGTASNATDDDVALIAVLLE